jgi:hypothetical protein
MLLIYANFLKLLLTEDDWLMKEADWLMKACMTDPTYYECMTDHD